MKHFFMSYSHPVLTTTIVSLPGPHVSHHQWDPNVADKIISLPLCRNHIPLLFQILLCLPLPGESHTQTTISLCLSDRLVLILLLFLRHGSFRPAHCDWHYLLVLVVQLADVSEE